MLSKASFDNPGISILNKSDTPVKRRDHMKKLLSFAILIIFFSVHPITEGSFLENRSEIFGEGMVTQIGLVVKDIERTSKAYADFLGVDVPEWFLTDTVDKAHTIYKDRLTEARAKLAFFRLKNLTIELIEPVGGPSTWLEFLNTQGEGIHHIAFEIKGMDEKIIQLQRKGMTLLQKGDYEGGRYSYIDSSQQLYVLLELLENF
jgi:methylmalonyl-CoA/ethylmalonyl-CoA epimerase